MSSALEGRRVLVTRRAGQAGELAALLQARGAVLLEVPAIEIVPPGDAGPLDAALQRLEEYTWVVFSSGNAVNAVLGRLAVLGLPPLLGVRGPRVASVGRATSEALRRAFPEECVSLEPEEYSAAGLVAAFAGLDVRGARVLLPASARSRDELRRGLAEKGASVDVVAAYDVVEPEGLRERVAACLDDGFDLALFASPSAVEGFAAAAGERGRGTPAVVIGPTTEAAARAAGLSVRAVARPSTAEGLVLAAERALASSPLP